MVRTRCLALANARMDYIVFGRGKRPLILIQGLGTRGIRGSAAMVAWMYRCFARDYRVYLFDRRQGALEGVTVRALATDVAAAMDALGLAHAHVLGVSQGGMIAQELAIGRPELVDRLVLAVTLARSNATVEDVIHRWITLTEQGDMRALIADMLDRMYSDAYKGRYRPLLPLLTLLQTPKEPQRFAALARACLTCDAYDRLDRIACPVLVIGGRQDRIVTGEASEEIAGRLGCALYMYEALGHAAYEEAADFNRRVLDFFAG